MEDGNALLDLLDQLGLNQEQSDFMKARRCLRVHTWRARGPRGNHTLLELLLRTAKMTNASDDQQDGQER